MYTLHALLVMKGLTALMTSYDVNGIVFPICWNDDVWCPVGILAVQTCSVEAQVEKNYHFWLL